MEFRPIHVYQPAGTDLTYTPNKANAWNVGLYQSQRTEDRLANLFLHYHHRPQHRADGGTLYRYTQAGQLFQNEVLFDRAAWVYSVNVKTTLQLTPTWWVQGNVNYLFRRITAQGEDARFLIPNLSPKKSLLANRLTIQAQWQNIGLGFLPTNEQRITTSGRDFFTTTNYIQEKDIFLIDLSYSFRQLSKKAKLPTNEYVNMAIRSFK